MTNNESVSEDFHFSRSSVYLIEPLKYPCRVWVGTDKTMIGSRLDPAGIKNLLKWRWSLTCQSSGMLA